MAEEETSETRVTLKRLLEKLPLEAFREPKSAIHKAAKEGNISNLKQCLQDTDNDVNLKDDYGRTALYMAVSNDHFPIVDILFRNGAKVDVDDERNNLYLHICRDLNIGKLLLKAGCDPNVKDDLGNSALHRVVIRENTELVSYLLQNGADINLCNNEGMLSIHSACKHMSINVETLIKAGSNINSKDHYLKTPLHYACGNHSSWDVVDLLIRSGAALDVQDSDGNYPVHCLMEEYHMADEMSFMKIINTFLANDKLANLRDFEGKTILHKAVEQVSGSLLGHLLKHKCKADVSDNFGRTPLFNVGRNREDLTVVSTLLELGGTDVNATDIWGQTPLYKAIECNNIGVIKILVKHGASVVHRDVHGTTPLHLAVMYMDYSAIEFLSQIGADLNAQDNYLSTALHVAAWERNDGLCRYLLDYGADHSLTDKGQNSALDISVSRRCGYTFKLLTEEYNFSSQNQIPKFSNFDGEILTSESVEVLISEGSVSRTDADLTRYLSSILNAPNLGITLEDKESLEIHAAIENLMEYLVAEIGKIDERFACTLLRAGSSAEGTKICLPNEFDFMLCLEEFSKYCYPVYKQSDVQSTLEGSVSNMPYGVKYEDATEKTTSISDYFYIYLDKEKEGCQPFIEFANATMIPCYIMFIGFTKLLRKVVFSSDFVKDLRITPVEVTIEPALKIRWRGSRYKFLDIHIDIVPALRLTDWPAKSRKESVVLTPDLLQLPCVCVPKMTAGMDADLWRISMSLQETGIFKKLKPSIKNSYIAAKAMLSNEICPPINFGGNEEEIYFYRQEHDSLDSEEPVSLGEMVDEIVPSYILKMVFFYCIEEIAKENGMESIFKIPEGYRKGEKSTEGFQSYEPAQRRNTEVETRDIDVTLLKDLICRCEKHLDDLFVPSFFNPKHNVLGHRLVEGDAIKAKLFLKIVNNLLK